MQSVPPPIIGTAKLIKYADASAPVIFTGKQTIYVDGVLVGPAPRIAICRNIPDDELYLFLCDENWEVIAVGSSGRDVADQTNRAERWYQGIVSNWIASPYNDDDCTKYQDKEYGEARCSFCRRWYWEYTVLFSENKANICNLCVKSFSSKLIDIESGVDPA